jgi:hypothetical protein
MESELFLPDMDLELAAAPAEAEAEAALLKNHQ